MTVSGGLTLMTKFTIVGRFGTKGAITEYVLCIDTPNPGRTLLTSKFTWGSPITCLASVMDYENAIKWFMVLSKHNKTYMALILQRVVL